MIISCVTFLGVDLAGYKQGNEVTRAPTGQLGPNTCCYQTLHHRSHSDFGSEQVLISDQVLWREEH